MIKIFLIFILSIFLLGCQSVKDGLTLKKQSNADEFLVKTKDPLVLPPEFNELPTPENNFEKKSDLSSGDDIKKLLNKDNVLTSSSNEDGNSSEIEQNILKKIKNKWRYLEVYSSKGSSRKFQKIKYLTYSKN